MNKAIFLQGNIKRHLYLLTYPAIFALIGTFSFDAVDTFFVAKLGSQALAAISFVFPVIDFVIGIAIGLGIAASSKIAQALGQNDHSAAKQYATTILLMSALIGICLMLAGFYFNNSLFRLLGASPNVLHDITTFTNFWYPNVIALIPLLVCSFILRAYGKAKLSNLIIVIAAFINIILDPILIFGLLGAPKMGIAGASLAGLIARIITLVLTLYFMHKHDYFSFYCRFKKMLHHGKQLTSITIPASITNFIPALSIALATRFLANISESAVAGYGLASKMQWIAVIPLLALSGSLSPIVAQNFGANNIDRMQQTYNLSIIFTLLWGALLAVILFAFKTPLAQLFSADINVINVAKSYFVIVPISYIGWGMVMMSASNMNAVSKPIISTIFSIIRMLVVFIPVAYLLKSSYGYQGIFFALFAANLIAGIVSVIVVRHHYQQLQISQPSKPHRTVLPVDN